MQSTFFFSAPELQIAVFLYRTCTGRRLSLKEKSTTLSINAINIRIISKFYLFVNIFK